MPYKHDVTGSSPVVPTTPVRELPYPLPSGAVVQLVRTPACHAGGRGFKSLPSRHLLSFEKLASYLLALLKERNASVAQLVEQRTENWKFQAGPVRNSSPQGSKCAAIAQSVERILGKDEVSGSNPDSSSKKTPVTAMVTGVFCFYETPAFLSFGVNLG